MALIATCKTCGLTHRFSDGASGVTCICGSTLTGRWKVEKPTVKLNVVQVSPEAAEYDRRRDICSGCKFHVNDACVFYLKRCTLKKLWRDQVDPPTACPNREKFL